MFDAIYIAELFEPIDISVENSNNMINRKIINVHSMRPSLNNNFALAIGIRVLGGKCGKSINYRDYFPITVIIIVSISDHFVTLKIIGAKRTIARRLNNRVYNMRTLGPIRRNNDEFVFEIILADLWLAHY